MSRKITRKNTTGKSNTERPQQRKKMFSMRLQGATLQEIGKEFNLTPSSVSRAIVNWENDNLQEANELRTLTNGLIVRLADEKTRKRKAIYDKALTIAESEVARLLEKQESNKELERADFDWLLKFIKMDNDTDLKMLELNKAKKIEVTTTEPQYDKFFVLAGAVEGNE